jgi:hypothetical protein
MIIDVDPGIDDAMAIFYAVRRPAIKLEALTTTSGNTDTAIATDNALRGLCCKDDRRRWEDGDKLDPISFMRRYRKER